MIELVLLCASIIVFIFAALTVYAMRMLSMSDRVDKLLKKKNLLGYSDIVVRERDHKIQEDEWKKNHPKDPRG